jgi:hypothetical protein
MVDNLLLDRTSLLDLGGSRTGRTVSVVWFSSTNPEALVIPWDCYLTFINSNQATNTVYISTNGRTAVGNPGVSGIGGGLLGVFLPNGTATSPWYGRSRIKAGESIWQGGTSAAVYVLMNFEIIE